LARVTIIEVKALCER